MSMTSSWFTGECSRCEFPVVVTQPALHECADYRWYCSNPECPNHKRVSSTGDMEMPLWVRHNGNLGDVEFDMDGTRL